MQGANTSSLQLRLVASHNARVWHAASKPRPSDAMRIQLYRCIALIRTRSYEANPQDVGLHDEGLSHT